MREKGGKCLLSKKFWNGNAQYNPQNFTDLHANQDSTFLLYEPC